ncbi:MAG: K(+)-transporting ATPase subunit F [Candidatus Acidulodesulfobacterium sp.]
MNGGGRSMVENIILLIVSILVLAYLFYVLIYPDKF